MSWVAYCLVRLRDRCCNPHQQRLEFMWNSWHRVNFTGTHFKETRNQKRFDSVSRCRWVWSINSAFISCTGFSFPTFADLNTTSTAKSNVIEFPLVCTHFWAAFAPFPLDMSSLRAVCPNTCCELSSTRRKSTCIHRLHRESNAFWRGQLRRSWRQAAPTYRVV